MNGQRLSYADVARVLGTGLISTGLGLLFFVFVTVAYGDPFTKLAERSAQDELGQAFEASFEEDAAVTTPPATTMLDSRITCPPARRYRRSLKAGAVAARLRIPRIGMRKYVVKGTKPDQLSRGPGLYQDVGTAWPGCGAPVAIAGHRTTHGAPFLNIDRLRLGDPIVIDMPYGRFTYRVTKSRIITPRDWSIIDVGAALRSPAAVRTARTTGRCPGTCEHLVLTACHPKYSAAQRIAVFARLDRVQLRGAT